MPLSVEKTKQLYDRIRELELDVKIGKSDINKAVSQTRKLYTEVSRLRTNMVTIERLMVMSGITQAGTGSVAAVFSSLMPQAFIVMFVFQMVTMAINEYERREEKRRERERAKERIALRTELVNLVREEQRTIREAYRRVVPA